MQAATQMQRAWRRRRGGAISAVKSVRQRALKTKMKSVFSKNQPARGGKSPTPAIPGDAGINESIEV